MLFWVPLYEIPWIYWGYSKLAGVGSNCSHWSIRKQMGCFIICWFSIKLLFHVLWDVWNLGNCFLIVMSLVCGMRRLRGSKERVYMDWMIVLILGTRIPLHFWSWLLWWYIRYHVRWYTFLGYCTFWSDYIWILIQSRCLMNKIFAQIYVSSRKSLKQYPPWLQLGSSSPPLVWYSIKITLMLSFYICFVG